MKNPIIQFENYTFKYRTQKEPTLKNINLTIYEGEKVLIVGPSGSGKSTLSNCINGLVPFSYKGDIKGKLTIKGKTPHKAGIFEMSQIVGTVLQDPDGQFVGLTVGEDIAFSLENDCVKQVEMKERVYQAAKTVGVHELLRHSPQELSGGQKQRVSMAGVMVVGCDILLFDEPLANLDPATGKYAIDLIDKIHNESKKTIIIIEHRLEDVLYRDVDRIVVVANGGIVADLTTDEILSSNILKEHGIREPLYISALKYAGCQLKKESKPSNLNKMELGAFQCAVRDWYQSVDIKEKENMNSEILKVSNLSFGYDDQVEVVSDISFSIKKGEMISIVGKNGAGKSTLSKLICGFQTPTKGMILYDGQDMISDSIKERAEKIGIVMQNPNQMISKSMIKEEVALGLIARGVAPEVIEKRVDDTLRICGLYQYRNWPIQALSFGQKKRVTIASILVLQPKILILDEPTAGQDFRHYTEIMEFLKKLNKEQGITIILITHDMHLMLEYTDRAIVIADGKLIEDNSSASVLTNRDIIEKASLKETSLYDLALRCDIDNPTTFVERFIQYDREVRSNG
ncbi:ABC transporter ATP-binding protein [Anaeromicropila herbilytica]|uniref:Putative ABC transporter ATP-binding protein n=1 Tax=Anaeromicropila herbilytica TaxID=2785025 RepID=A0A7R7EMG3_9FIRM|nr:ABC transporter ATP-binding protein [Anaeromicropila herbilytica]BCN31217.1 putative ABC transporter ATP-binding protein [Anaeromicropila herbilytica]